MARRTKEDALATRNRLLDAAELLFQANGVSATSLNDIATHAGATRGAVYWHFQDKADLLNAMMERVSLPLEHALTNPPPGSDPLVALRAAMLGALKRIVDDPGTRRVFEVATHKVEYVDSLGAVRQRHLRVRAECLGSMQQALRAAARGRGVRLPVTSETAALGLYSLVDGLIQNWLLDSERFNLVRVANGAVQSYLAGLGLGAPATA